jgi:hypothetical protein
MTSSKSKIKGTAGETELLRRLNETVGGFRRTPASSSWDLERDASGGHSISPLTVLATRPDFGRWLVLMTVDEFEYLLNEADILPPIHVEVKRRRTYAHHSLFNVETSPKKNRGTK